MTEMRRSIRPARIIRKARYADRWVSRRFTAPVLITLLGLGCHGRARVDIVYLDADNIDPPPTDIIHFKARECYWYNDGPRDLVIAMRTGPDTIFTPYGKVDLDLSFVFDAPPGTPARTLQVGRREIRGVFVWGAERHCFISQRGICSLTRKPDGHVTGSFRLFLLHQPGPGLLDLFPRRPSQVLFVGDFDAIPEHNDRAHHLRDLTEAHGWGRAGTQADSNALQTP